MRRKSERTTVAKKAKASPEKKAEKVKRTRSRRKKQSSSSENDSDDPSPERAEVPAETEEPKPPKTPVKEVSPEEAQDPVWKVTAAESSGNVGEIQKLKICLTRPPSTPERAERSPRSKRKHSRATSSSDTTSVEATDEKEKRKLRRSKRAHRESKDESEKNMDSQEEMETETIPQDDTDEAISQSKQQQDETSENTITTSNQSQENVESSDIASDQTPTVTDKKDKVPDADTTVVSPKVSDDTVASTETAPEPESSTEINTEEKKEKNDSDKTHDSQTEDKKQKDNDSQNEINDESSEQLKKLEGNTVDRRRSMSVDKSEILELHPEDSKSELDDLEKSKTDDAATATVASQEDQVSKVTEEKAPKELKKDKGKDTNITGVVENSNKEKRVRNESTGSTDNEPRKSEENKVQHSESIQSNQEEPTQNGSAAPIVVTRKRRWGSRPSKITTQKSITISTDVLKEIIPDVKPVEFDEVIEERRPKREVSEKVERPVLPKIVIDNTENIDRNSEHKKESREKDVVKPRENHLAASRKISIVKDNDSIIARPPSPPRHKQSCVLYITNLVRPFTLPQLKNLLQRTGKIVENGFWIDKIKSKCFVIYENEDQAVETRHALHGVTWPVSNPKTLQVDFSTQEAFEKAKTAEETNGPPVSTIPGTVEDWLREQDQKRARGELEKPWERRPTREWDLGKNENEKEKEKRRDDKERPLEKKRHRSPERSPEPARKFKKKEEEAPAKLLDDLFKKTKTTPCIYWLPLSAETIAIKEEQRRLHMAEHERRMLEQQQRRALRDRERDRDRRH